MNEQLESAHAYAKRKARYGHRDWIVWTDKSGEKQTAVLSADSLKQAMLATGTQGWIMLYAANTATPYLLTWPVSVTYFAHLKRGTYSF